LVGGGHTLGGVHRHHRCDNIVALDSYPSEVLAKFASMVSVSVTSNGGVVTGDNPITHALLLLIIQMTLIIALSRCLALLLRPLRQPRVVAGKFHPPSFALFVEL